MLQSVAKEETPVDKATQLIKHFKSVMMEVIEHERRELHHFRKRAGYDDDMIRTIENRLDLEEERLQEEREKISAVNTKPILTRIGSASQKLACSPVIFLE